MPFPKDFTWGVSACAYQIEGAAYEDGKGLSVWDAFCRKPGAVWGGHTGDVACDHYHRWKDDLALMKAFGIRAYRFSVSWPRVLPEGVGAINPKGLAFYDRLIDEMLAAGIEPWLMPFHWDYPQALYCRGGWLNPDSPDWFADYVRILVEKFSDRVRNWFTHLELACFIGLGHQTGEHAPGLKLDFPQVLLAGHHALLAHGKAALTLRAHARQPLRIGIAPAGSKFCPITDESADVEAARALMFKVNARNCFQLAWWLDPVYLGRYPEDGLRCFGRDVPAIGPDDLRVIHQPLDFCSINYYSARLARAGADGTPEVVPHAPGYPQTTQDDWAIVPRGLRYACKFLYERYGRPIVITENGHQNNDSVMLDGKVHDPQRIDYTRRHLLEVERALAEGVPIQGYLHWTFMDNFEWAFGYKVRVGLVHTDYQTLKRTPKDSAHWYKRVIETNGAALHED